MFNYYKIKKSDIPYIIAEIGVNHEGSLEKAKRLIYYAKKGGAHAAKFQTYKASKIAVKKIEERGGKVVVIKQKSSKR